MYRHGRQRRLPWLAPLGRAVAGQHGPEPARIIPRMRINLVTPFAEKDAAKALGARWDSAKKTWYVTDVADLAPLQRWLPDKVAATANAAGGTTRPAPPAPRVPARESKPSITTSTVKVSHCGCDVLPWDDCVHTANPCAP